MVHSNYVGRNQITKFTSNFYNYGGVAMKSTISWQIFPKENKDMI